MSGGSGPRGSPFRRELCTLMRVMMTMRIMMPVTMGPAAGAKAAAALMTAVMVMKIILRNTMDHLTTWIIIVRKIGTAEGAEGRQ